MHRVRRELVLDDEARRPVVSEEAHRPLDPEARRERIALGDRRGDFSAELISRPSGRRTRVAGFRPTTSTVPVKGSFVSRVSPAGGTRTSASIFGPISGRSNGLRPSSSGLAIAPRSGNSIELAPAYTVNVTGSGEGHAHGQ